MHISVQFSVHVTSISTSCVTAASYALAVEIGLIHVSIGVCDAPQAHDAHHRCTSQDMCAYLAAYTYLQ